MIALCKVAVFGLGLVRSPSSPVQISAALIPHGYGVEDTYTITTLMKLVKPYDAASMTDAYQDAKLVARDADSATFSITYFPLDDQVRREREQMYSRDASHLSDYLKPTTTCNWDQPMRAQLLTDLNRAGIDQVSLGKRQFVQKVADWAFDRSKFISSDPNMPPDWYVGFRNGTPEVLSALRSEFDAEKPSKTTTDQQVFDQQLFGKQMYFQGVHGACTSSSIYLATILRCLGIPTRILYFVPACDGSSPKQVAMLTSAITRLMTRKTVSQGLVPGAFSNHMFNEVWIDGRWVRLNYNQLDQNIVDEEYLGLMTHIVTTDDVARTHLAETWGLRSAKWPNVAEPLSSVNPYMLLAAKDHWGARAKLPNPKPLELTRGTVIEMAWPGSPSYSELVTMPNDQPDFLLLINEWIPTQSYRQLRDFIGGAGQRLTFQADGHPDVHAEFSGYDFSGPTLRGFGFKFVGTEKMAPNVNYRLVPENERKPNQWIVPGDLRCMIPKAS